MPTLGLNVVVVGVARSLRLLTTLESASKKTSKGIVDAAKATIEARTTQEMFAQAQLHGATVSKVAKDALKLTQAQTAKLRAEQALATIEAGKFTRSLYLISFAAGVASAALLKISQVNLKAALSAEKYYLALDVLTEYTDASTDAVAAEIAELENFNITTGEATRMVSRLMAAKFDYTKASDIALMGTRQSVLNDLTAIEVIERMTDAIVNRTTRGLKELDLLMRTNETFDEFAENLEIATKNMTESERSQAIFNAILKRTNVLVGVENELWERGSGQLQIYHTQIKDLQESLGKGLLPAYIDVLKVANAFLDQLNKLPQPIKTALALLALAAGALAATTASTLTLIGLIRIAGYGALLTKIGTIIGTFATSIGIAIAPLLPAVAILAAFVAGLLLLRKEVISVTEALVSAPFDEAADSLQRFINTLGGQRGRPLTIAPERQFAEWFVRSFRKFFGLVVDEAKKAGKDAGKAFVDALVEEIEARLRQIEIDLTHLQEAFDLAKAKSQLILIPLEQQEKFLQRGIVLLQREATAAEELAEGPLKNAQAQLKLLGDISKDLDRDLWPYEAALRRVEASAAEILIPMRAQERSLQRQLDLLERRIALERRSLEIALRTAELSLRGIEDQIYALDKALWPLQDAFTQIRADADLVLIPLRRQQRAIERQIDSMTRLSEIEQERIERHLRALEQQRDALQEIIDVDRDRLELINHEIFMEQLRNRILQRVTSAGLLTMQSQSAVLQDQLDLRQEQMKALNEQTKDERERLQDVKDILEEQLEPLKERLQILVDAMTLEEDRVTFAQENLRLEEARQTASRITLEQQRRLAEEEVEQARRRLEDFDELAIARTQALRDDLTAIGDLIAREEERIQAARDALDLERARQTEIRLFLEETTTWWENQRDIAEAHLEKVKEFYDGQIKAVNAILTTTQDTIYKLEEEFGWLEANKKMADARFLIEKDILDKYKEQIDALEDIGDLYEGLALMRIATTEAEVEAAKAASEAAAKAALDAATTTILEELGDAYEGLDILQGRSANDLLGGTVPMPLPVPTPSITSQSSVTGPTIQLVAHYGKVQSIATIKDDVELMLSYAH